MTAVSDHGKPDPERAPEEMPGRGAGPSAGALLASGLLVAGALLVTAPLTWPEQLYATLLIGVLPALVLAAGPPEVPPGATRHGIYTTTWLGLWMLAALAFAASLGSPDVPERLGLVLPPARLVLGWTVVLVAAGGLVVLAWHRLGHREADISRFLMPETGGERVHYAWVSLTAGFTEEVVFRGFLVRAVEAASGSILVGVAAAAAVFGVSHRYQGWGGAARAGALGAVLTAPLLVLGSIVPAILAHALLDLLAGLWWRERLWGETIVPPRSSS